MLGPVLGISLAYFILPQNSSMRKVLVLLSIYSKQMVAEKILKIGPRLLDFWFYHQTILFTVWFLQQPSFTSCVLLLTLFMIPCFSNCGFSCLNALPTLSLPNLTHSFRHNSCQLLSDKCWNILISESLINESILTRSRFPLDELSEILILGFTFIS